MLTDRKQIMLTDFSTTPVGSDHDIYAPIQDGV